MTNYYWRLRYSLWVPLVMASCVALVSAQAQDLIKIRTTVTQLEQRTFGRTYTTDLLPDRLSRLERKITGSTNAGSIIDRTDTLLLQVDKVTASQSRSLAIQPSQRSEALDAQHIRWTKALRENPTVPENHIGLGQAYQAKGSWDQAEAEYKQALVFDRNNEVARKLLYGLADAKKQSYVTKHINAGVSLQARKNYDEAIKEYTAVLSVDPSNADLWVNIGTALRAKGDYERALGAYSKALSINPDNTAAQDGIKTCNEAKERAHSSEALLGNAPNLPSGIPSFPDRARSTPGSATGPIALQAHDSIDFGPYIVVVRRRIQCEWSPPKTIGESKPVVLLAVIHTGGQLSNLRFDQSSGVASADNAAMQAVQNAAPFRPLPNGYPESVQIQVTFDLSNQTVLAQVFSPSP